MDEAEFVQSVNRNGWPFSILNQSCGREETFHWHWEGIGSQVYTRALKCSDSGKSQCSFSRISAGYRYISQ